MNNYFLRYGSRPLRHLLWQVEVGQTPVRGRLSHLQCSVVARPIIFMFEGHMGLS